MENLIAKQINNYLLGNNFLFEKQSGFMKARSCTVALINILDNLMLKLDYNYVAFLVLLDHTNGAFFSAKTISPS